MLEDSAMVNLAEALLFPFQQERKWCPYCNREMERDEKNRVFYCLDCEAVAESFGE